MQTPSAIFLMGPTASGKTDLALNLAKNLPVEIISVDSAMVYKGMDIGTGKPSLGQRAEVPHHLIDIRDPTIAYSAAEFAKDALNVMHEITERQRIPLLVGGTMLYFRALQQGLALLPPADQTIRTQLLEEANEIGWVAMHQRLKKIDPKTAERIHPNDPQRIQRALEVYEITKQPMSKFFENALDVSDAAVKISDFFLSQSQRKSEVRSIQEYHLHSFAIAWDRAVLHQRIEQRFHQMLQQGFVQEVETLYKRNDLTPELPSMRAVGYRQIWSYLAGEYDYDQMVYKAIAATRQLAKRQLTWLRSLSDIKWLENNRLASVDTVIHCVS